MSQHKHLWKLRKTVISLFFETGQKRKRYSFSVVQTTFLEAQLKDNKLVTPEDRQKVVAVFTKETFDVERIHTWFRNHKKKNKGGFGYE